MKRATIASERGAVLLIALILMALLTVVATSTLRLSTFGLRMAVGEELRSDSLQRAQSLVDDVMASPANLMITNHVGDTNCVTGVSGCTANTLVLKAGSTSTIFQAQSSGSVQVRRIGPEYSTPPRLTGYSAVKFEASYLQVESSYDGTAAGWGKASTTEGVAVIVPQP
jgi:Tfp pilus assembly protein PilX